MYKTRQSDRRVVYPLGSLTKLNHRVIDCLSRAFSPVVAQAFVEVAERYNGYMTPALKGIIIDAANSVGRPVYEGRAGHRTLSGTLTLTKHSKLMPDGSRRWVWEFHIGLANRGGVYQSLSFALTREEAEQFLACLEKMSV